MVNLLAVPASILGNEVALRIGRRRWILLVMAASGSSGQERNPQRPEGLRQVQFIPSNIPERFSRE